METVRVGRGAVRLCLGGAVEVGGSEEGKGY